MHRPWANYYAESKFADKKKIEGEESIKQFKILPGLGKKLYFMPGGNNDAKIMVGYIGNL